METTPKSPTGHSCCHAANKQSMMARHEAKVIRVISVVGVVKKCWNQINSLVLTRGHFWKCYSSWNPKNGHFCVTAIWFNVRESWKVGFPSYVSGGYIRCIAQIENLAIPGTSGYHSGHATRSPIADLLFPWNLAKSKHWAEEIFHWFEAFSQRLKVSWCFTLRHAWCGYGSWRSRQYSRTPCRFARLGTFLFGPVGWLGKGQTWAKPSKNWSKVG